MFIQQLFLDGKLITELCYFQISFIPGTKKILNGILLKWRFKFSTNTKSIYYGSNETITYNKYYSKKLMDKIDKVLATHYGFTDEELEGEAV